MLMLKRPDSVGTDIELSEVLTDSQNFGIAMHSALRWPTQPLPRHPLPSCKLTYGGEAQGRRMKGVGDNYITNHSFWMNKIAKGSISKWRKMGKGRSKALLSAE
jgi:hypothetical protein